MREEKTQCKRTGKLIQKNSFKNKQKKNSKKLSVGNVVWLLRTNGDMHIWHQMMEIVLNGKNGYSRKKIRKTRREIRGGRKNENNVASSQY